MRTLFILMMFLYITPILSFAHSPVEMTLSYDLEEQKLHLKLMHTSKNLNKHYIRKISIQLNDQEPVLQYFQRQKAPAFFKDEVPFEAEDGDTITVKAYCKKGGTKENQIIVGEQNKKDKEEETLNEQEQQEETEPTDATTTTNPKGSGY